MHAESGHQLLVHSLIGSAMLLICYTAVAFICYAIGRYGLRELFVDPNPQTASGRLLTWIRQDAIRFGCWLATAIMYGLLLALTLRGGMAAMAAALLINFVIPPALLVINGIYALRPGLTDVSVEKPAVPVGVHTGTCADAHGAHHGV